MPTIKQKFNKKVANVMATNADTDVKADVVEAEGQTVEALEEGKKNQEAIIQDRTEAINVLSRYSGVHDSEYLEGLSVYQMLGSFLDNQLAMLHQMKLINDKLVSLNQKKDEED